jgi:hypothetical protein
MKRFEEPEEYAFTTPAQHSWLSEPIVTLVTALITLAAGILSAFGHTQKTFLAVLIASSLVFLWLIVGVIRTPIRRVVRDYINRRYVAKEYPKLKLLFERLGKFTSKDDGRSFRNQLYGASCYRHDIIDNILTCDYIEDWLMCYAMHLQYPCRSIAEFLSRCREFTAIVNHYNTNYVIKTQKSLGTGALGTLPDSVLDKFEEFRERFSAYLNELEQWADSIAKDTEPRVSRAQFCQGVPHRSFDRVKSFTKKTDVANLVKTN